MLASSLPEKTRRSKSPSPLETPEPVEYKSIRNPDESIIVGEDYMEVSRIGDSPEERSFDPNLD